MPILAVLFALYLICGLFGGPMIKVYISSCFARIFLVLFGLCLLFLLVGFLVMDTFH